MAAAAWSWVEKMLHDDQVTWAPRAVRVSMRTALAGTSRRRQDRFLDKEGSIFGALPKSTHVWMVMCRHPATASGTRVMRDLITRDLGDRRQRTAGALERLRRAVLLAEVPIWTQRVSTGSQI